MTSAAAAVPPLSIGQVAEAAAVNVQTLRYYERVGLVPAPKRSRAGYRQYTDEAVRVVSFVKRAQELGFTLKEIRELLKFRMAGVQRRDAVRAAATAKVADPDPGSHRDPCGARVTREDVLVPEQDARMPDLGGARRKMIEVP
jgi:DNA-binding transcriptional MerR regulator